MENFVHFMVFLLTGTIVIALKGQKTTMAGLLSWTRAPSTYNLRHRIETPAPGSGAAFDPFSDQISRRKSGSYPLSNTNLLSVNRLLHRGREAVTAVIGCELEL
jgi:hypothetical protein